MTGAGQKGFHVREGDYRHPKTSQTFDGVESRSIGKPCTFTVHDELAKPGAVLSVEFPINNVPVAILI